MKEQITRFKTRLFGGFDKRDVINYLKSVSVERNSLRGELDTLRKREQELSDELALAGRLELSESVIEDAAELLERLEAQHESIGGQIRALRERFDAVNGDGTNDTN